jgi:3-oxoacyl-[acyl-carrier protein] reductase
MAQTGYGRFVYISSTSVREPIPGLGVSNTLRAAMAGWAKTLSRELPPGVTINTVLPGFTDTDRLRSLLDKTAAAAGVDPAEFAKNAAAATPPRRFARPEEIGAVVAFLASPAASYVNGVNLPVDGGRLAVQ